MKIVKIVKDYMKTLEITSLEEIKRMSAEQIRRKVNEYDNKRWKDEMLNKSTLQVYKEGKMKIKEKTFYDNTWRSVLMFRARSNTLYLNWRNKFAGGDVECKLCNSGVEET